MQRSTADELLFFSIHGVERTPQLLATTGLHFYKNKCLSIPANQINFPTPWCAKIPPEDFPSEAFQMDSCLMLTPTPKRKMPFRM